MDRMDAKWTKRTINGQKFGRARGQTQSQATAAYPHVFETERDSGTPDKIRTCDLLLRRQTAITCYLRLTTLKWTLSGQKRAVFDTEQGVNLQSLGLSIPENLRNANGNRTRWVPVQFGSVGSK